MAIKARTGADGPHVAAALVVFQCLIIVVMTAVVKYHPYADAKDNRNSALSHQGGFQLGLDERELYKFYIMFQDVHVMIFAGFGFLMSFLKRYGYSSTGFTLLLGALMVQWGILCHGFFRLDPLDHKIPISIERSNRDPTRCVLLQAVDAGGSMYVHVFGAYFGLAVSLALGHGKVIAKSEGEDSNEGSSYTSDIFAMIGELRSGFHTLLDTTAFNAGLSTGDDKHRAVINTYLSLASCCVMAFATSAVVNKDNKFDMVHIQNSTLAGGVAVGTVCDLMIQPFGAVLIGMLAGVVSVLGYRFLQPYLLSLVHLHDTCGVNNLHGIPGVMSGVMGAVVAGLATEKDYNYSLYQQFPARMPPANSSDYWEYAAHLGGDVEPGVGRSASGQAGYQLLALCVTFLVAWVSGALTGAVMISSTVQGGGTLQLFSDDPFWHLGEDERVLTLAPIFRVSESRTTRTSGGGEDMFSTRVLSLASISASVDQSWGHVLNAGGLLRLPVFSGVAKEHLFDDGPYWKQDEEGAQEVLLVEEGTTGRRLLHEMSEVDKVTDGGQEG
uniref:Ammonium transporter AmtB-like domain-containing protein n=1 Tax=Timema genevievae TaxID=629358 RepID=A0A7R9K465_TIMGE|nr:unnamed protein product [Timema genevievae]